MTLAGVRAIINDALKSRKVIEVIIVTIIIVVSFSYLYLIITNPF